MPAEWLDDPHAPAGPPPGELDVVLAGSARLRRRRALARGVGSAAAVLGALGAGAAVVARGESGDEVHSVQGQPDVDLLRGEVIEVRGLPDDLELASDAVANLPDGRLVYERSLQWLSNRGGPSLVLLRTETAAAPPRPTATSPGGIPYSRATDSGQVTLTWVPSPGVELALTASDLREADLVALLDGVEYGPPVQRCVVDGAASPDAACRAGGQLLRRP